MPEYLKISEEEQKEIDSENHIIVGIDEVGIGPAFGPIVACACLLDYANPPTQIMDSKSYSSEQALLDGHKELLSKRLLYEFEVVDVDIINAVKDMTVLGYYARYKAFEKLMWKMFTKKISINSVFIDHFDLHEVNKDTLGKLCVDYTSPSLKELLPNLRTFPITKGDTKILCIAAASVLAKVKRDLLIMQYEDIYPEYDIKNNKGYLTKEHKDAIEKYGITHLHRNWWECCKNKTIRPIPEKALSISNITPETAKDIKISSSAQEGLIKKFNFFNNPNT